MNKIKQVKIKLIRIALNATYKLWHPVVNSVISRCYEDQIINSEQLHEISARLDASQKSHYRVNKTAWELGIR